MATFAVGDYATDCGDAVSTFPTQRQAMRDAKQRAVVANRISPTGRDWQAWEGPKPDPQFSVYRVIGEAADAGTLPPEGCGRRRSIHIADVWANITRRSSV